MLLTETESWGEMSKWCSFSRALQVERLYQVVSCRFKRSISQGRSNNEKGLRKGSTLSSLGAFYVLAIIQYISVKKQYSRTRRVLGAWLQVERKQAKKTFLIQLFVCQGAERNS